MVENPQYLAYASLGFNPSTPQNKQTSKKKILIYLQINETFSFLFFLLVVGLCMFVCKYMFMSMCLHVYACACMWKPEGSMALSLSLNRQQISLILVDQLIRNPKDPPASASPVLELQAYILHEY